MTRLRNQGGQALLIVLLSMAVVLTIVLSVLSRSVTDIAVTSRGEESIRAFSAAEAGVEKAIIEAGSQTTIAGDFEGADFDADIEEIGKSSSGFIYPLEVAHGDTATIWFVSHDSGGNFACGAGNPCFTGNTFRICWGENATYVDNLRPAIEVSVLYLQSSGNPSTARIARAAYDSYSDRRLSNLFDPAVTTGCTITSGGESKSFPFSANINLGPTPGLNTNTSGLQLAIVRMLYNTDQTQPFGVDTSASIFPSQGQKIKSTGTSGEAVRKVEALRLYSDLPSIFHNVLFSPSGITK